MGTICVRNHYWFYPAYRSLEIHSAHYFRLYLAPSFYPNETSASLDRIDSNQGYIEGNVRWVLKDINMIKGAYDNEYFVRLCNLVANAHPREVEDLGERGRRRHEKSPFEKVQNVSSN